MKLPKVLSLRRDSCVFCHGDGKCSECSGTGVNTHLNETEPKCQNCAGTGVCPNCQGAGRASLHSPDMVDLELDK